MEANNSIIDIIGASLIQSSEIRIPSRDSTVTLRGLQLNDSGVYACQIDTGNYTELKYIKLTVNGKFLVRMATNIS